MYKIRVNNTSFEHPNPTITGSEIKLTSYAPSNQTVFWNGKHNDRKIEDNEIVDLNKNIITCFRIPNFDILDAYRRHLEKIEIYDRRRLDGLKIVEYIKSEYEEGKRKFIISFPYEGEKHFIIHPDGKDGKTIDIYF